jgi:AraC-like DNA-binding protein
VAIAWLREYAVRAERQHVECPSILVTVAVGHRSKVVTAGLVATLARMPGYDIRLSQGSESDCDSECNHDAQLVFGDSVMLERLRGQVRVPGTPCSLATAKFIWLTAGDELIAHAAKQAGEIEEHLPIDCPEEDLFAVVRRLASPQASPAWQARQPFADPVRGAALGGLAPGALRRVRGYIAEHLTENLSIGVLARIAALSTGHFNRAFKQSTGLSPHRYVTRQRVAAATELLRKTNRALADIGLEVGFADQSHFCRTYVAVTGETPSACRRRHS